jgi:hypothetical protein
MYTYGDVMTPTTDARRVCVVFHMCAITRSVLGSGPDLDNVSDLIPFLFRWIDNAPYGLTEEVAGRASEF